MFHLTDIGSVKRENHVSGSVEHIQILESRESGCIFNGFSLVVDHGPGQPGAGNCKRRFRRQFRADASAGTDKGEGIAVIRQTEQHRGAGLSRIEFISNPSGDQVARRLLVMFALGGLVHHLAVVIKSKPFHALEQGVDRLFCGTLQIGVLNAEQELSSAMAGVKPVENCGSDIADMNLSRGGRRESGPEIHRIAP